MLKGKRALVTGGARGNGEGIALGLADAGADVFVLDRLRGLHENIQYVEADLLNRETVIGILENFYHENIYFDILVNNAGISLSDASEHYDNSKWENTIKVNLTAPFYISQSVAKELIKRQKKGSIINITSLGAEFGFPNNPGYCASKGGLKQLTKAFAYDWAQYGIRVNNVGPGYMRTNMTEKSYNDDSLRKERDSHIMLKRWGTPHDLAGICVFLSSDASEYITGQDIYVDGGWTAKGL